MASYGAQQNGSFSSTTLNQISTAVANGLKLSQRSTPVNTGEKRRQDYLSGIQKEATLARALTTEAGLRKVAANMANPVRFYLDYKGIFRKI